MITIKIGDYNKDTLSVLLDALYSARNSLPECSEKGCEDCPYKIPCSDIYRAIGFIEKELTNRLKKENK